MIEPRSRGWIPAYAGMTVVYASPFPRHRELNTSLAMTWRERRPPGSYAAGCATFALDHGCRSAILIEGLRLTARHGMFDGMFEGFTTFSDRAACLTS
jgi:hypothetical protein